MKALRNYLDKIKPNFEEGGKLAMFRSVFEGFETFLFVPNETSKSGVHIHDSIDSKRTMTVVIIALLPASSRIITVVIFTLPCRHFFFSRTTPCIST